MRHLGATVAVAVLLVACFPVSMDARPAGATPHSESCPHETPREAPRRSSTPIATALPLGA